ncbi:MULTISPECIES: hypothetical protein [unclassified Kitasatospora]|uniref:hypothetical protein n=1 Tax=unclassified Kitasatospora TaxID=2633591 RepID=UPI00070DA1EE|nr:MULTISPECIES: hypothetical protein [unclassified Kitasatospora]KQV12426.1 hypothetical protein ASC99_34630 [Kitasatospora sp. Root107]KRB66927.1 hypothetical protein ASE03_30670 [Kitasatospora sp. Root187]
MKENVTLVVSVLAFLVSVAAVIYTHLQLSLARRIRREQLEPFVVVDIAPHGPGSQILCLTISNTGPTVARDVKVRVKPELRTSLGAEQERALARATSRTIPSLAPGRVISYMLDTGNRLYWADPPLPLLYTFEVCARGPFGDVEPLTYVIDLEVLKFTELNGETTVGQLTKIAENTKKAASNLEQLRRETELRRPSKRAPGKWTIRHLIVRCRRPRSSVRRGLRFRHRSG